MWSGISYERPRHKKDAGAFAALVAVVIASVCAGPSTTSVASDDDDDHTASGRAGKAGNGGSGGKAGRGGSAGRPAGAGGSAGSNDVPYVDPGCPDTPAPPAVIECDVFSTPSGCPDGLACKPYIDHPYGSGCDQQVFNMRCVYPGSGQQGDFCDDGMSDCDAGYICVVGAAHGSRCLQMCPLDGSVSCPLGLVCGATDAEGIGVCA